MVRQTGGVTKKLGGESRGVRIWGKATPIVSLLKNAPGGV